MNSLKTLPWPLVLGLGVFALIRPLMSIVGLTEQLGKPAAPLLLTLGISVVWIASVGLSRVAQPVLALALTGLMYGVCAIILSAILSPILSGELQGPLATPGGVGVIATLVVNAIWGAIAGLLALAVQRIRARE